MDHEDAVNTYAAERYLLGELEEADADSFEAHMFDCRVCAEQVRLGIELFNELRKSLKNGEHRLDNATASGRRRFCRTFPGRRKPR
jgi:anti-sigma factor RsiW